MEVTAIKIWFEGWWSASRGTAWPLEQAVELEESKEAVRGEDLLIIRTPFNKLSPVIKRRKCSACSTLNKAGDRKYAPFVSPITPKALNFPYIGEYKRCLRKMEKLVFEMT